MPPASISVPLRQWVDPEDVFVAIAADARDCFWLDAGPDASTGWSWLGLGTPEHDSSRVRSVTCVSSDVRAGESPFRGGWVGWFAYDHAAARAGAPRHPSDGSDAGGRWLRVDELIAFDHLRRRAWAISRTGGQARLADAAGRASAAPSVTDAAPRRSSARHEPDEYAALIERCRDHIRDGDAYQLCLTTRFTVPDVDDPLTVYRRLRRAAPSHHGGFVRVGADALLSASPERFVELSDGVIRTRPIKGTRPRHPDPALDTALAEELRADPKERAENVMIVDLMRNDLSRVCEPGEVVVDRLLEVESYAPVHQLVSSVSGTLRRDTSLDDVLTAVFPAGSMTGAPKLSAMTILAGLEGAARGVYAGCFGWVGDDGAADLAMVIRSIHIVDRTASVGAGGGITWRSQATAEVAEVGVKARAPLAALGASLPPGW